MRVEDKRAAQYLRMSTEHQRYSLLNQAEAIAQYAFANGLKVVESYEDAGKSGVTIKGRTGLQRLLADVVSGRSDFSQILVYDVSRWGRFQDPDQAAHYEFLCRQGGYQVRYCTEPFDNDGSMSSTILKHIKRVMAAEFSRELSEKCRAAQIASAKRGFAQGGSPPFGIRRQLVAHDGTWLAHLRPGQRKALQSERVVYIPGAPEERRLIRRIFHWYGVDLIPLNEIVSRLSRYDHLLPDGETWTDRRVQLMLRNEIYRGIYVFNKTKQPFRATVLYNPRSDWVRIRIFAPIVSRKLFAAAAQRLQSRKRPWFTDEELLRRLRRIFERHGHISHALIENTNGAPSAITLRRRFGSLKRACELIGVKSRLYFCLRDDGRQTSEAYLLAGLRRLLAAHGYLSNRLITADPDLPSSTVFKRRFGNLPEAYRRAGWSVDRSEIWALSKVRAKQRRVAESSASVGVSAPLPSYEGPS